MRRMMRCSFCGRRDAEVAKLVAGPRRLFAGRVYICDRCAKQTIEIMEAHWDEVRPSGEAESFCRRTLNRLGWWRDRTDGRSECHAS
jgi:ATP-dependent protease Clp ATPase subunit